MAKFKANKTFTGSYGMKSQNHLFGKGAIYEVSQAQAEQWAQDNRGEIIDSGKKSKKSKTKKDPPKDPVTEDAGEKLPETFLDEKTRALLEANGFTSIAKLAEVDSETLSEINGIGKATVTKIGLALG